jgi:hypothetical protein
MSNKIHQNFLSLLAFLFLMSCAKPESLDSRDCVPSANKLCIYDSYVTNPTLSGSELLQIIALGYLKNAKAIDKLIAHYGEQGDVQNRMYWCYKGADALTNAGIYCAAGFELLLNQRQNCENLKKYYRSLLKTDKNAAKGFIKFAGLSIVGEKIACIGPSWNFQHDLNDYWKSKIHR